MPKEIHFFPQYQVSFLAESREEALTLLNESLRTQETGPAPILEAETLPETQQETPEMEAKPVN